MYCNDLSILKYISRMGACHRKCNITDDLVYKVCWSGLQVHRTVVRHSAHQAVLGLHCHSSRYPFNHLLGCYWALPHLHLMVVHKLHQHCHNDCTRRVPVHADRAEGHTSWHVAESWPLMVLEILCQRIEYFSVLGNLGIHRWLLWKYSPGRS